MIQRTHINQHVLRANKKVPKEEQQPVITSKTYKENKYFHNADIICKETGKVVAQIVYRPESPLSCGSVLWIETDTDLVDIVEIPND